MRISGMVDVPNIDGICVEVKHGMDGKSGTNVRSGR